VFGLYGDQRTLVLNTLCVRRPTLTTTDPNAAQSLNAIHGELKTVAYFIGGSTAQTSGQTTPGAATLGLARLEGDHLAIGYAMQQSASIAATAPVIAPEVALITFRYFDGTQWLTSWDSSFMQALPRAVECTITVRAPDANGWFPVLDPTAQAQTRLYRHVVAISTMAQPMPITELATIPTGTTP